MSGHCKDCGNTICVCDEFKQSVTLEEAFEVTVKFLKDSQEENKKLRDALGFYANKENWVHLENGQYNLGKIWVYVDYENRFMDNSITTENGKRAREALKELE